MGGVQLGHRRFGFVSGSIGGVNGSERYRGLLRSLESAELPPEAVIVCSGASTDNVDDLDAAEPGRAAARELPEGPEPPTATMAINDGCALGVCAGVRDAGQEVGWDVSVVVRGSTGPAPARREVRRVK
ncbi:substrate-binding domain-containing protein [Streptomyces sp. NPDC020917]|uniref:substrate-binding domain-containing protein n=1 Tax=Streptomyces sp. NPDC020917 TaxID=3365102 RepID=UPI0037BA7441